jgi:hypothetical protein
VERLCALDTCGNLGNLRMTVPLDDIPADGNVIAMY